jgi:transposase
VAQVFDVSPAWVRRLKQRRRELGTIEPLPPRYGYPSKFTEEDLR